MPKSGKLPLQSEVRTTRPVRMRDVAEMAGVGTMTVSRVLNGTARVTEETASRVYSAIKELKYKPNHLARALRGSRSNTIGLLLPYLFDPFFAMCAHAINMVAQEHGYSMILATTNEDASTELDALRQMVHRQVDGMILIPAHHSNGAQVHAELRDIPIVTLDRPLPYGDADSVQVENEAAGELGTKHLISHGHKNICFLGLSRDLYTMAVRHRGYEIAMRNAGLQSESHFDCHEQEIVTALLEQLLRRKSPPTALLTSNGLTTRYVLHALAKLQVKIPAQIALIGFDDVELSDLLRPRLTVLRQPVSELGHASAKLLFQRLLEKEPGEARQHVILPVELVVRGSCGCTI